VQDAAGHCLLHVEHILNQDPDPQAAIRLAKRMIVDGRMPSPEQALHQLRQRNEQRNVQRTKTRANKQTKQTKTPAKTGTNKQEQEPEPLGDLIIGDITARPEPMPVIEDRKLVVRSRGD
jgi:hypothetical protein